MKNLKEIYEDEYFLNLWEQTHLQEIAVLRKSRTKLTVNIFVDDEGRWMKSGHFNRIKFQPDKADKANSTQMIPMSIEDNPKILARKNKIVLKRYKSNSNLC